MMTEPNQERARISLNLAIKRACAEIALVSASFPHDTKSWAKIIKRHLKSVNVALAAIALVGCAINEKQPEVPTTIILEGPEGERMQFNKYAGDPPDVYHLLGKPIYE